MNKIRLISLFSGYDSQALAMERLKRDFPDFDYELVAWCEIDFAREPIHGLARTLKADNHNVVLYNFRIRKLTPRECFRLMDMDDADIDKIDAYRIKTTLKDGTVKEKPIPKSQKYKLAGNSIVVSCLYHIFKGMFIDEKPKLPPKQLDLFDDLWQKN